MACTNHGSTLPCLKSLIPALIKTTSACSIEARCSSRSLRRNKFFLNAVTGSFNREQSKVIFLESDSTRTRRGGERLGCPVGGELLVGAVLFRCLEFGCCSSRNVMLTLRPWKLSCWTGGIAWSQKSWLSRDMMYKPPFLVFSDSF